MRHTACLACAVLIAFWAGDSLAQESTAEPRAATDEQADEGTPQRNHRERLEQLGIEESSLAGFVDGQPLSDQQRESMAKLLYQMQRIGAPTLAEFSRSFREIGLIARDPSGFRGDIISLLGLIRYVVREELDPVLREKLQIDAWYRCRMTTFLGTDVTVYTLSIPRDWPLDTQIRVRSRALAMFVKRLPSAARDDPAIEAYERISQRPTLMFVTPRMAWYPGTLLGRLGMDFGLFDDVRDRGPLEERECFYQMLAAVRRADDGQAERVGRKAIAERHDLQERMARNPHQLSSDRAAAQRALDRGKDVCDDVVPLFNDPAGQRGELFLLSGEALRAIEIRVDDPDIVERFGFDHYYEIEIITPDSQNNPIVCCVAEIPPDMPLGESIHQGVRVAGFFLKSWAFDSRKSAEGDSPSGPNKRRQLAPLLIAKTVRLLKAPESRPPSIILPACLVVLAAAAAGLMWYVRRGDRRALANAAGNEGSLPTRIAYDPSQDAPFNRVADDSASDDS